MTVIEFDRVSKMYHLGSVRQNLREAIPQAARRLIKGRAAPTEPPFWAIKDVSFRVEQGDVLGIIGHNGAGKSTILKLLSRVTYPTSGQIRTSGRIAALIELGAGFHPELSGRDNIYLNGSILGLKRREIDAQFSNIVEFAGLEKFIDTPVKRYSSGMYVRLAFAVAAHVRADLLLIDEVLSVGDAAFQQKCHAKMDELRRNGATIVLVSHDMWSVHSFCKAAILLQGGQIKAQGDPGQVIEIYRQSERQDLLNTARQPEAAEVIPVASPQPAPPPDTVITAVTLLDANGQPQEAFEFYETITVRISYTAAQPIQAPLFIVKIRRSDGLLCCVVNNRRDASFQQHTIQGAGAFSAYIGPVNLIPDFYTVEAHILDSQQPVVHASSDRETFRIKGDLQEASEAGVFTPDVYWMPAEPITSE